MRYLIFALALVSIGCAPRSDIRSPVVLPQGYYEEKFAPICSATEEDLCAWWEQFNDSTLSALIQKSLSCSYDLRIAEERVKEVRGIYKMTRSRLFPEVDVLGCADRTRESQTLSDSQFLGKTVQNYFQSGFDAAWELDFLGKNASATLAARYDLYATEEDYNDVKITIISEIARSYIAIRSLQKRLAIAERHIHNENELLEIAEDRIKAGLSSEIDLLQGQAQVKDREAFQQLVDQQIKKLIYGLSILVGEYPEKLREMLEAGSFIPCAKGKVPVGLPSDLMRRRPDIRRAELQLFASQARLNCAIAELFPSFALTSSIGYASGCINTLFNPASHVWNIGAGLFWPIFDAGRIRAHIRVQTARQQQALLNFEKTVMSSLVDVETSLVGYYREIERQEKLTSEVESLRLASLYFEDLYASGLRSFSDVLQNQRLLFNAEDLSVQSEESSMIQLIALFKALGGGWQCLPTP